MHGTENLKFINLFFMVSFEIHISKAYVTIGLIILHYNFNLDQYTAEQLNKNYSRIPVSKERKWTRWPTDTRSLNKQQFNKFIDPMTVRLITYIACRLVNVYVPKKRKPCRLPNCKEILQSMHSIKKSRRITPGRT
jgi:type IV secretory pathway TraG/TraD family ATPase VirD4